MIDSSLYVVLACAVLLLAAIWWLRDRNQVSDQPKSRTQHQPYRSSNSSVHSAFALASESPVAQRSSRDVLGASHKHEAFVEKRQRGWMNRWKQRHLSLEGSTIIVSKPGSTTTIDAQNVSSLRRRKKQGEWEFKHLQKRYILRSPSVQEADAFFMAVSKAQTPSDSQLEPSQRSLGSPGVPWATAALPASGVGRELALHRLIWCDDIEGLKRTLFERKADIDGKDASYYTPLHLALLLKRTAAARLLVEAGANVVQRDVSGWRVVQQCIPLDDFQLQSAIMRNTFRQRWDFFEASWPELRGVLRSIPDFDISMRWDFSSWLPLISRVMPSDDIRIRKCGPSLRLDSTLKDFNGLRWKRGGNSTYINVGTGNEEGSSNSSEGSSSEGSSSGGAGGRPCSLGGPLGGSLGVVSVDHDEQKSWNLKRQLYNPTNEQLNELCFNGRFRQQKQANLSTDEIEIEREYGTETVGDFTAERFVASGIRLTVKMREQVESMDAQTSTPTKSTPSASLRGSVAGVSRTQIDAESDADAEAEAAARAAVIAHRKKMGRIASTLERLRSRSNAPGEVPDHYAAGGDLAMSVGWPPQTVASSRGTGGVDGTDTGVQLLAGSGIEVGLEVKQGVEVWWEYHLQTCVPDVDGPRGAAHRVDMCASSCALEAVFTAVEAGGVCSGQPLTVVDGKAVQLVSDGSGGCHAEGRYCAARDGLLHLRWTNNTSTVNQEVQEGASLNQEGVAPARTVDSAHGADAGSMDGKNEDIEHGAEEEDLLNLTKGSVWLRYSVGECKVVGRRPLLLAGARTMLTRAIAVNTRIAFRGLITYGLYFADDTSTGSMPSAFFSPAEVSTTEKRFNGVKLLMSRDFPIERAQLIPVIKVLTLTNDRFLNIKSFLESKLPAGFPVKFSLPVFPTVSATVSFTECILTSDFPPGVFEPPPHYTPDDDSSFFEN
jgi:hypothetical protein